MFGRCQPSRELVIIRPINQRPHTLETSMSQYDANAGGMSDFGHGGPKQTNVLGIVGFILAFCTGPIGLIISLIALAKPPRGFAIAGVIVGLITTFAAAAIGIIAWLTWPASVTQNQYMIIDQSIQAYQSTNNGVIPTDLTALSVPPDTLTDFWGNEWQIEVAADGSSYVLVSAGVDGQFGTQDDIRLRGGLGPFELGTEMQGATNAIMQSRLGRSSGGSSGSGANTPAPISDQGDELDNGDEQ